MMAVYVPILKKGMMYLLMSSLAARGMLKFQKKGLLIPVSLYKAGSANCGFARTKVLELWARSDYFQWLKSEEGV